MSVHAITIDDFSQLDRAALAYALRLFEQELATTLDQLKQPAARTNEQLLDELSHLLTLRKVFRVRLDELQAEETTLAPLPASERFVREELLDAA